VTPLFTPAHRGGSGPPLVLLHGFLDTWRTWSLVLAHLERRHDVLAPTLPGHAGGPPVDGPFAPATLADAVERAMDAAGFATAHVAGNSLGGHVALQLAARGRARSVVAFAPAGGWAPGDPAVAETLRRQGELLQAARRAAPHAHAIAATPEGRRRATELLVEDPGSIPAELVEHLMLGVAAATAAEGMLAAAAEADWSIDAERVTCPVRIVWGTRDRLLPWPAAAARLRAEWMPGADWVEMEGAGHCPQLDLPLPAAQLILGFTRA
jgi:pimeloyl-ACP methyl ester carboxylesterase